MADYGITLFPQGGFQHIQITGCNFAVADHKQRTAERKPRLQAALADILQQPASDINRIRAFTQIYCNLPHH
ncbi:hypothetical protein D3C75_1372540 [compost metagenome]